MLLQLSQWRRFTPSATSLTPHTTGAQLDLLRNPLRARQRMTACKTASIDALWPQFIKTVANEAGPTDGQAPTSGRVHRRLQATVADRRCVHVLNASITIKTSSITTTEARSTVVDEETACVDAPTLH